MKFLCAFISGMIAALMLPEPFTSWQYWVLILWMVVFLPTAIEHE